MTLIITRGLPASGKTTAAKAWVAEDPINRVRINRDDLRDMMHNGAFITPVGRLHGTETAIIDARNALIKDALKRNRDVICDDTNIPQRVARDLLDIATAHGAEFIVWDFTDVPVDECIRRDKLRGEAGGRRVGAQVIQDMALKLRGRPYPLPVPTNTDRVLNDVTPYVPTAPSYVNPIVIVDIDGTVAKMNGRSPYDYSLVSTDVPNWPIIEMVTMLHNMRHEVIFCSGRPDSCRVDTEKWLADYVNVPYSSLYMRKTGDKRKDWLVKLEIFNEHIRPQGAPVAYVLDDRNQVVEMWRSLGLHCLQVADGNF